jgi:hypothetical protein
MALKEESDSPVTWWNVPLYQQNPGPDSNGSMLQEARTLFDSTMPKQSRDRSG